MALRVAGLGSALRQALPECGLGLEPTCAPPGSRPPVFWSSERVTATRVFPGQGQEDEIRNPRARAEQASGELSCSFILGNRAFAGLTHLLSRFQKFLSTVEETFQCICCQELVFRPITTVCQHNVCKVRGGRGRREALEGALTPAGTLGLLASLGRLPLALPGPQGLLPGLPGLQLLSPPPPAFITGALCPATTLRLQPRWPSAGPSAGWRMPTFVGVAHWSSPASSRLGVQGGRGRAALLLLPSGHTK